MARICASCDYLAEYEPGKFQCRKNAPQIVMLPAPQEIVSAGGPALRMVGTWPPMNPNQWCGEWRQRSHSPAEDGARVVTAKPEA